MYISPEDGTFVVDNARPVQINGFRSIYRYTEEGHFLLPATLGGKIVFEQEYMLPLHLLERRDGAHHLRIQLMMGVRSNAPEQVEVPDWGVKLVEWEGRYFFVSEKEYVPVGYGYRIEPLPEGYEPAKDLPPLL
ncbi:hypothetical protein [Shimazuella kribbensis]|uniref:hypothetical protein n=1 Tax=Shimazuella kribbensis TaxID=139808 RepID=UPI000401BA42|nr:hypothetical protein [Shimazuella kribbensis]